jgi:Flp pilus assembly protein TadG
VEFALLLPLLMLFLFGIIQYGYGLFQLQTFNATLTETTRQASTGIVDCTIFDDGMKAMAHNDGLDPDALVDPQVQWLDENGAVVDRPELNGQVRVTASYHPFKIGLPFIPFPDTFTRSQTALVQDLGDLTTACGL